MVAVLTFSVSGVTSLVTAEPCAIGGEFDGSDDEACPPTCVTCGCCAQAVEAPASRPAAVPLNPAANLRAMIPSLPTSEPYGILHVPKPSAA